MSVEEPSAGTTPIRHSPGVLSDQAIETQKSSTKAEGIGGSVNQPPDKKEEDEASQ